MKIASNMFAITNNAAVSFSAHTSVYTYSCRTDSWTQDCKIKGKAQAIFWFHYHFYIYLLHHMSNSFHLSANLYQWFSTPAVHQIHLRNLKKLHMPKMHPRLPKPEFLRKGSGFGLSERNLKILMCSRDPESLIYTLTKTDQNSRAF